MSLRIAHILGSLGMGGAERVALDLATVQQNDGHEVCVISLSETEGSALAPAFADAGITVHVVPKRPGLDWRLPREIASRLKELKIQVAHTHNTQPLVYAAAAARLAGLVVVHTKHGEGHLVSRMGQFLRRAGSPFVHSFVAVSEKTAEHARQQWAYPMPSKIRVIPNGIALQAHRKEPRWRQKIREELGIAADAWVVVTVGRCDINKNQVALVRAAESLLSESFHLVIVGAGEAMGALKAESLRSENFSCIHLLGRRHDVPQIMSAADLFVLPSLSEGLPLVLLEAMAAGLPVVSTAVGGIPDVIEEGKTGLLVAPNDEGALLAAMSSLYQDREKAAGIAEAGYCLVSENYSAKRMSDAYVKLYEQAL